MSISAVVLNWNRPRWLRWVILPRLARHPEVSEIHISHGREETRFAFRSRNCRIIHRPDWELNREYGLALRFVAAREAANDAVLLVDDDLVVPHPSLSSLHASFSKAPRTLHGIFGRRLEPGLTYSWDGYQEGEAPILLTRCLMMNRSYAQLFLAEAPGAERLIARGTPRWNGEDIFLSLLSLRETGNLPMAYDLPFKNVWRMHRRSISKTPPPRGAAEKLTHRKYRVWFTREAADLLGVRETLTTRLGQLHG